MKKMPKNLLCALPRVFNLIRILEEENKLLSDAITDAIVRFRSFELLIRMRSAILFYCS